MAYFSLNLKGFQLRKYKNMTDTTLNNIFFNHSGKLNVYDLP